MEFLGTYRGAALYKVQFGEEGTFGHLLEEKVRAEAFHPARKNLKVDFEAKGKNQEDALEKLTRKIDRYLEKHNLNAFDPSHFEDL